MNNFFQTNYALDSCIPVSLFNNGGAAKIFDEVRKTGYKIVVKDDSPDCVIISREEMLEMLDDIYLAALAEARMKNDSGNAVPFEEILTKNGITQQELDAMEDVEIE